MIFLVRLNSKDLSVEGEGAINLAAFKIHAAIHDARPDVVCAAHSHSMYGKTFSTFGK
jgi:ribulose-5-phosphate 4-epimerase/fuculose-1-phosphate aldolase